MLVCLAPGEEEEEPIIRRDGVPVQGPQDWFL